MTSKLDNRLQLYERDHPILNDEDLLNALEAIFDEQEALPVDERDLDLVSEVLDAILMLKGYDEEQLKNAADQVAESLLAHLNSDDEKKKNSIATSIATNVITPPRQNHIHRLGWIILVAIIGVMTATSIGASVLGYNLLDSTKDFIVSLKGKTQYSDDNHYYIRTDDAIKFSSLEELSLSYCEYNLWLPNALVLDEDHINIIVKDFGERIIFEINSDSLSTNNDTFFIKITHSATPFDSISTNTVIGNTQYFYSEYDGLHQGELIDSINNNSYVIQCSTTSLLNQIIISMEENHE